VHSALPAPSSQLKVKRILSAEEFVEAFALDVVPARQAVDRNVEPHVRNGIVSYRFQASRDCPLCQVHVSPLLRTRGRLAV